jgi:hypothetical protein
MYSSFFLAKSTHEPKAVSPSAFVRPVRPIKRRTMLLNYRRPRLLNLL